MGLCSSVIGGRAGLVWLVFSVIGGVGASVGLCSSVLADRLALRDLDLCSQTSPPIGGMTRGQ